MNAVEIQNLSVNYEELSALKDINITIKDKEFVAILGPNGGGKSTLLKAILGLIKPSSGQIKVYGKNPQDKRNSIGYVPQFTKFEKSFPIDVIDVVLMGRLKFGMNFFHKYSKEDIEFAENIMNMLDIYELKNRQIGQLSGGQMQKVLIARALCTEPKLLLLDEPTASVDVESKTSIYSLLKDLNKNITILVVTHDTGFVFSYVDKIACLNQKLFYHGEPELDKNIMDKVYGCPVDVIAHGEIPHRVFRNHQEGN
ncbi:metal ABC transporter ATP-binding protein [Clostridium vincentii]|uniref:High-affinity zinc uptake system ATP-binding protein ZnuC n=1 Tax=Clostridium vincentii TaxID=52704 RepID=A0A2T0BB12_9CLOT|nr:ABC transporter ATP-binding protein [Clostridium vincentii]PRR81032.1 High-affinity zinc uptake system ATP-binding protein ZnuC [Clostridium vincentii]